MVRPHGVGLRGASLPRSSLLFGGPFGRIFRALPAADYGVDDAASIKALSELGAAMSAGLDPLSVDPDPEEGGIPAAYTYFGQFIDHDLTFDPASSLQKQNDPDALTDYRTPRFDLDNLYGRGPDDQPYLYDADGRLFLLGRPLTGAAANPKAQDLVRSATGRAIIGDPRNDENVIVSQLQGLMLRFHNAVARKHPKWSFGEVQRHVRFHYQWVVLNDFLTTIVSPEALGAVAPHLVHGGTIVDNPPHLAFYHPRDEAFMPLEFSAAAYRFGHSMVRPGYVLNETVGKPLAIFNANPSLGGFQEFPQNWAIDWSLFLDLEPRPKAGARRTQLAYRLDTSLVNPLAHLPHAVASDPPPSLGERNLIRGWRMRLPTGQAVAKAMGLVPLTDPEIHIGKFTGDPADKQTPIAKVAKGAFVGRCPLWAYVLAETVKTQRTIKTTDGPVVVDTFQLGPVGGRIVAETFMGLMLADSSSFLSQDPLWKPHAVREGGRFGLRQLIKAALE